MKKIVLIAATICACACAHKEEPVNEGPKAIVTFGASAPVPDAKVAIDGEGKATWVAGDKITIYYDGGSVTATAQSGGSASTTFETDEAIPTDKAVYCAVYPSTRNANFDGSDVTVDFTQGNEAGTLACSAICTAKTTTCGGSFAFHNAGAMIKFTTTSNKIHEARFYGDNGNVYTIVGNNSDSRVPYASGTYYVPIPAGESTSGFSLRLKNYDGEDYPAFYRPASRTFEAGHIYNVGTQEEKVFGADAGGSASFRLMSFNILRADQKIDDKYWTDGRREACIAMLEANAPDILGLQECTSTQRNDILEVFPQYGAVGISVKGSKIAAYPAVSSNPILYNVNKFTLEAWGTFWLSETPDTPNSYTWYYDKPRTATWARFKVKGQNRRLVYVCLHLQDNISSIQAAYKGRESKYGPFCRGLEMGVVTDKLSSINPDGYPMIISGDFNSNGTEDYYDTLRFTDGFSLARLSAGTSDTGSTHTGGYIIDNIFYKGFTAFRFVVDRTTYNEVRGSDHYPVYCDFCFSDTPATLDGWEEVDL
ncbi:MAG: endonuclease/exonuclease/phosphatase family protein [Bacteroidales bacterium]|nr:endonuclease/exonuclease/phosphatase family protein [Bacteroidales bacterium]